MAEGIIGEILGGDEEKPEVEAPEARASAEAFAAAIVAIASRQDPAVARKTEEFLSDQSQLLKVQKQHLQDEHALRLTTLRNQVREQGLRRFGMGLRVAFQLCLSLLGALIGIGVIVMLFDAFWSRSIVIDPIEVSPAIAAQSPNGKMVAAGLLDVLTRIQALTSGVVEHRSLSNAWSNEIEIDVPETGISIAQLERILKARLGHDQHVEGDLAKTKLGGLALTVRAPGILAKTFTDDSGDLEKLVTRAGEYVYGQSQPAMWTLALSAADRNDEAIQFAQAIYPTVDPTERPRLMNSWADALIAKGGEEGSREAVALKQEAVRLKSDYWSAYADIITTLSNLGDEEGAIRASFQMMKAAGGRPGRAPEIMYTGYDANVWDISAALAETMTDMESRGGVATTTGSAATTHLAIAQYDVQLHDTESAAFKLSTIAIDEKDALGTAMGWIDRGLLGDEENDLVSSTRAWDAFLAAYANPAISSQTGPSICYAAVPYERAAQPAKADASLDAVGHLTFVDCYRFKGDILDSRGDWAGAQEWYGKAVNLGPSIPSGYYSWGLALAKHGDLDGAAAKFKAANQKGPHWADPLKAWGDVLAKQGHAKEALAKYHEALKYAPNWSALRTAAANSDVKRT